MNTGIKAFAIRSETGLYLFDLVDPGTYTVTIEAHRILSFVQETSRSRAGTT